MHKKGILLINLGTPENPDIKSVRHYLREFLSDPRVIDLPRIFRWLLLNLIILPIRPKQSALAYQKIWTKLGSPLLIYSNELKEKLSIELGANYQTELGMRYGNPNIEKSLNKLKSCSEIIVLPLFPQYSSAATGSAIEKTLKLIAKNWNIQNIKIINTFYNHPKFISAYSSIIKNNITTKTDLVLFSYHGLPERHINKSRCQAKCDRINVCPEIKESNSFCYRAQCYTTSNLLAKSLHLTANQYKTSFQSRLGRTPWIKPYTDLILRELIQQGIKNIVIVCPSFVTDCLETLEEIGIRAKKDWQSLGGDEFTLVPCLNSHELWLKALKDILTSC